MPYVDHDSEGRRWVSERDVVSLQDPIRRAAETLARDVETFLYDTAHFGYGSDKFLAAAVTRYDLLRTGSGNYGTVTDEITAETIAEMEVEPFSGPTPSKPGVQMNVAARFPDHARERLAAPDGEED